MGLPIVKIMLYIVLDTGRTAEGWQKRLGIRMCIEDKSEVVSRIDSNRTVFDISEGMWPVEQKLARGLLDEVWEYDACSWTYTVWVSIQGSSLGTTGLTEKVSLVCVISASTRRVS